MVRGFHWAVVAGGLGCLAISMGVAAQDSLQPPPPDPAQVSQPEAAGEIPPEARTQIFGGHSEVVVTPTLTAREPFSIPTAVTVLRLEEIERSSPLSVVDALGDRVGIWLEKRTASTSDPVIRGLSGSNLLALVDGNTLSTFWGEGGDGGDDMYGKVDAENVERIEVVRGPRSVLYGSNALGGVINFITRSCPYPFTEQGGLWGTEIRTSTASAASEARYRQEFFGATPHFRFILGGSLRSSSDVRRGGGDRQVPTSGHEHNWDFKGEWKLPSGRLTFAAQDVRRRGQHRFYRPTQNNDNDRRGFSLEYASDTKRLFWDRALVKGYYQFKEDRRRFWDQEIEGVATTRTWTVQGRAEKRLGAHHTATYGLSYETDLGESADDEQFTYYYADGTVEKSAPDTRWQGLGLFVQEEWEISSRARLSWALRGDEFRFASDPDSLYHPAGGWDPSRDRLRERKTSLIGSAGVVFSATPELNLIVNYGRGYRLWAPQFGVTQRGVGVVVPSGLLDPVVGDTWEIGLKREGAAWELNAFAYHSRFSNWQTVVPSTFDGRDWYDFNGNGVRDTSESVYITRSVGAAWVQGVEVEGLVRLGALNGACTGWSLGGGVAFNRGRVVTLDEPLHHTQPPVGKIFAEWNRPDLTYKPYLRLGAEVAGRYDQVADEFLMDDPGYRVDPQDSGSPLVRPYGLPGYSVFSLRGGLTISKRVGLRISVDNLGDKLYRRAHSRWDEAGLNAALMLRITLGD